MKKIFTLIAAVFMAVGAFAQDATLIASYEAVWEFYNDDNEEWIAPDESGVRTLEQYSDGTYKIINAFGSENENDVLTFVLTSDNITFQNLKSHQGAKYIYYTGTEYSYIYDSECEGGEYSSYSKEDGWDSVMFYIAGNAGNGYYCLYWQGSDDQESEEPAEGESLAICGIYNIDNFSGWESYWWSTDYSWHTFEYNGYEVELVQLEGNQVSLVGLLDEGVGFIGTYDPETSTIAFLGQDLTIGGYDYIFCKEEWADNTIVVNKDAAVVATVNEDGIINLDGWTIVYDYGDGINYWTYFSGVKLQLSKNAGGINDVLVNVENAPVEYYNLNGVRVDNPTHGIYIVRQGSKVSKRAIR